MRKKRILGIFLLLLLLVMTACGNAENTVRETPQNEVGYEAEDQDQALKTEDSEEEDPETEGTEAEKSEEDLLETDVLETPSDEVAAKGNQVDENLPVYGEYYYDVQNVVLYLDAYNELPSNYITKKEAQALGWEGGSVEKYKEGAAIGGDTFGNREGILPKASGRKYTECDIDTNGYSSRGARRLVFSNDGLYFYTSDHYETFKEITITENYEVVW